MSEDERNVAVIQIHSVVFSQVMAIVHSMLEFRVPVREIKKFIYRVCTIHQLSEKQRIALLIHLRDSAAEFSATI